MLTSYCHQKQVTRDSGPCSILPQFVFPDTPLAALNELLIRGTVEWTVWDSRSSCASWDQFYLLSLSILTYNTGGKFLSLEDLRNETKEYENV